MNEFLSWNLLHHRPWDTQPRLTDAETDELFELMGDPALNDDAMSIDMADGYMTAIAAGPSPVLVHVWLEDIFAQHLVHKTVLSIASWAVFGALLLGRLFMGWRGRTAVRWTLSGFGVLLLAYFGSKIMLEWVLGINR